jgi:acyl-CoA reductase-like NAD-dependent aldehyde dehydrogenase
MSTRLTVWKTCKLYIGGAFPRSESGRYFAATSPEGRRVANMSRGSRKDCRNAVAVARGALAGWSGRTGFNRGQILYRLAEMIESRRHTLAAQLVADADYSAEEAERELDACVDRLVWYAGWGDKFTQFASTVNPVSAPYFNFSTPEAVGVVVIVAPRHAPLLGLVTAIAPVIIAGNTVLVVVDGPAPTLAIELAEAIATSDVPGGVVNIVTGFRDELLPSIAAHRDIDAIALYGSPLDERRMVETAAADAVKRVWCDADPSRVEWLDERYDSPYRILPFIETKTAWHPVGQG